MHVGALTSVWSNLTFAAYVRCFSGLMAVLNINISYN